MANYFYTDANGYRQGPFNEQQLQALATQGIITPNTPLETDTGHSGLAGQFSGLFPEANSPFAQSVQSTIYSYADSDQMIRSINSRFWYFWFFMVIGLPLCFVVIGLPLVVLSWTSSCFLHYSLWKVVPPQIARTTPGKALGFCFIPFFNLFYWNFVSLVGLSKDINETLRQRGINLQVSVGLPLTYCILLLVNIVTGLVIDVPLVILAAQAVEIGAVGQLLSLLSTISGYVINFIAIIVLIFFYKSVKEGAIALLEQGKQ